MTETTEATRLYSSWRGRVLAFSSPLLVLALAALGLSDGEFRVVPVVLLVVGVGLLAVVLFDFPMSVLFDASGITRRTVLRAHRLPWARVEALERARGGRLRKAPGPLTAVKNRRRYLLIDQSESQPEYDAIALVVPADGSVAMRAAPPPPEMPPTWLYHRKREA